jgi:hypothetical protein
MRKECTGGAVEVTLIANGDLLREEDGLRLMREQVAALRQAADKLEQIAQNWAADLEAGRRKFGTGGEAWPVKTLATRPSSASSPALAAA